MRIDAEKLDHVKLNEAIKSTSEDEIEIVNCLGHRFIAAGLGEKQITISGIPGNALGAYLNGADIDVLGNAQDAVGDTMNDGRIVVRGSIGDAAGYAMRGGEIFVRGSAGYRAGVHMKQYESKIPVIIIGGRTGSFLGEYQAGGYIVVLGLHTDGKPIVGNFPCTGMHGGRMFLRGSCENVIFPPQVNVRAAEDEDMDEIRGYISDYCAAFGLDADEILSSPFTVITPDSKNPYKQMYVTN